MKIKIVGDGTAMGTKVINTDTGECLTGVNYILYEQDPEGPARVMLGVLADGIDVQVDNVDTASSPKLEALDSNPTT